MTFASLRRRLSRCWAKRRYVTGLTSRPGRSSHVNKFQTQKFSRRFLKMQLTSCTSLASSSQTTRSIASSPPASEFPPIQTLCCNQTRGSSGFSSTEILAREGTSKSWNAITQDAQSCSANSTTSTTTYAYTPGNAPLCVPTKTKLDAPWRLPKSPTLTSTSSVIRFVWPITKMRELALERSSRKNKK